MRSWWSFTSRRRGADDSIIGFGRDADYASLHSLHDDEDRSSSSSKFVPGWRATVIAWAWVVALVLVANLALLIWATTSPRQSLPPPPPSTTSSDGLDREWSQQSIILFQGDCTKSTRLKNASHLVINMLGGLLLVASTNCMQCLSAPTRKEVDAAHAAGKYLDIGVLSARNLFSLPRARILLWTVLALSSMPLHFFYNSTIYSSLAAHDVLTFFTSKDYESAPALNQTGLTAVVPSDGGFLADARLNSTFLHSLFDKLRSSPSPGQIQKLSMDDCLKVYTQTLITGYANVALVSNLTNSSQVLDVSWHDSSTDATSSLGWACYKDTSVGVIGDSMSLFESCEHSANWKSAGFEVVASNFQTSQGSNPTLLPRGPELDHCLAEVAPQHCTLELAPTLLIIVIVANALKLGAMIYTALFMKFSPLVTIGDSIASFLAAPDKSTEGVGILLSRDLTSSQISEVDRTRHVFCEPDKGRKWMQGSRRWFHAVSKKRWILTMGLCVILEATSGRLLAMALGEGSFQDSQTAGFGGVSGQFYSEVSSDPVGLALLTNLPQMLVSLVYVLYYSLMTSMLLQNEMANFTQQRKAMRVSPPRRGEQRSTYWLVVPYRYSLPLLAAMTMLHWFISQSLFLLRVNDATADAYMEPGVMTGVGYSPIAIVASMSWGAGMIAAPLILAWRRYPRGVPLVGQRSLAIAAACHPDARDPPDVAERRLMYGVLPTSGAQGLRRVAFSALEVEPLVDGEHYEGSGTLRMDRESGSAKREFGKGVSTSTTSTHGGDDDDKELEACPGS